MENLFKLNDMIKGCSTCINFVESECVCADECTDFDQWYIDEGIVEKEWEEALEIVKEIYNMTSGRWGNPVISEDLYNRMKKLIEVNV